MYKKFEQSMKKAMDASELVGIPDKYLQIKPNYLRVSRPITAALHSNFKKGLDFGCGMGFCSVLGRIAGIEIVGLDIPTVGGEKRNKKGIRPDGPSPYLSVQKNLQKMGYPIVIADTNEYPWDFKDDEFEFVIAWFSLTKQHMNKENWSIDDRVAELVRITKPSGRWMLYPQNHVHVASRYNLKKKKIKVSLI